MSLGISSALSAANIEKLDSISNDPINKKMQKKQELGQDAFLKLMMSQLANQDPLSPLDNAEMIAQMAQFSSVEQLGTISKSMKAETKTSEDILAVLSSMLENSNSSISSDGKLDDLITKTDKSNELNTDILNELIKLNKSMEAYGE